MRPRKIILSSLVTLLALTAATGTASGHRGLGLEGQTRITGTDPTVIFATGERIITCEVTLEGTTVTLTAKTRGASIGSITRGVVAERGCRDNFGELEFQGELRTRTLLPWTITYDSITGTLPNIADILILVRALFKINVFISGSLAANCTFLGTFEILIRAPRITALTVNGGAALLRSEGGFGFLCFREGRIEAEFVLGSLLTVTLLT